MPSSFPLTVNLQGLEITVHLHDFFLGDRERQCWTYITRGLQKFGQQELTLSLLLEVDDVASEVPKTPLRIFSLLAEHARQGRHVRQGMATRLGKTGLFGFTELYYLPSIQYADLPVVDDHLALILVHGAEHDFARRYGLGRLISRIAKHCSCFPYATWNTRLRPSFVDADFQEDTLLNQGATERSVNNVLLREATLTMPSLSAPGDGDILLLCNPCSYAESSLNWAPQGKTTGLTNNTTPQSCSVSFVLVTSAEVSYVMLNEDGVLLALNTEDREQFNAGQLPSRTFLSSLDDATPNAAVYRPGAGISEPLLAEQILLDERRGNTHLTTLRLASVPSDRHQLLVHLADEVQQKLVVSMSEENSQFCLEICLTEEAIEAQASIDLNPEFVNFLRETLAGLDRSVLGNGSLAIGINFNLPGPQTIS